MTLTPALLTPLEAAAFMRCSRRHLENLVRRGLLRARKIGRLTRFRQEDLETFIANQ